MSLVKKPLVLYLEKIQRQGKIINHNQISVHSHLISTYNYIGQTKFIDCIGISNMPRKCCVYGLDVNKIMNRQKCAILCLLFLLMKHCDGNG